MPKKIPMRRCVVTHEQFPKNELLRIVRTPEGNVEVDLSGKLNGRGAYIKKDIEVMKLAKKNCALAKALEVTIPEEFWDKLEIVLKR